MPIQLTKKQLGLLGLVLLAAIYYAVVYRPSTFWAYYIMGKARYKEGFEPAFVRAWAAAKRADSGSFTYQNKSYSAESGKLLK